jgi:putative hydrolase of the HAD superfamily
MRYKAVIFDLFGTLVDLLSEEEYKAGHAQWTAVLNAPFDDFRKVWSSTIVERDTGRFGSLEGDLLNALGSLGLQATDDQIRQAVNTRLDLFRKNLAPRKGAVETLAALRARGLKTALISVCGGEIPSIWPETAFAPLMDCAVFSCSVGLMKPEPEIYHLACKELGVRPEDCLYVGDGGYYELAGAETVGMHSMLIKVPHDPYPYTSRQEALEWQGPTISSLPELLDLVNAVSLED